MQAYLDKTAALLPDLSTLHEQDRTLELRLKEVDRKIGRIRNAIEESDGELRALVERLSAGPASVSELAAPLPMSLPAVMLHLKVLEQSGLVVSEKKGRVRTCRIDPMMLSEAERWVADRRRLTREDIRVSVGRAPHEPIRTEPSL